MSTIIEQSARKHVDEYLTQNPKAASVYYEQLRNMSNGFYGVEQDMFIQKWAAQPFDIVDAYYFAQLRTKYLSGQIGIAVIGLSDEPASDKNIEENNRILQSASSARSLGVDNIPDSCVDVPDGFVTAEFWGGTQGADGSVSLLCEVPFMYIRHIDGKKWLDTPKVSFEMKQRQMPLEVGYCSAAKINATLNLKGAIARWPYGHKSLYLFVSKTKTSIDFGMKIQMPGAKVVKA